MRAFPYWSDLGFDSDQATLGSGKNARRVTGIYLMLALGIFLRQISAFPKVDLRLDNLRWNVVIASVILALAIAPLLMRWISARHKGRPSWEHVTWSLTYGFFSDLLLAKLLPQLMK